MKTLGENCYESDPDLWPNELLESALGKQVSPGWSVKVFRTMQQPGLLQVSAEQTELHFVVPVFMDEREEFTLDEAVRVLKTRIHGELGEYLKKITYPFGELLKEAVA